MSASKRGGWLTIPDICADLRIPEADWQEWRQRGQTPLHVITTGDGQARVRSVDYEAWLDSLTEDDPEPGEVTR